MQKMIIYKSDLIVSVAYTDTNTILSHVSGSQFNSISKVFDALRANATAYPSTPVNVLVTNCCRKITRHYILPANYWTANPK